jgi:hypothetical protein
MFEKMADVIAKRVYDMTQDAVRIDSSKRIDVSDIYIQAWKRVDIEKVIEQVKDMMEAKLAESIFARVCTENGTDIKSAMSDARVRKELQDWLKQELTYFRAKLDDD